jgi:hypothetical protein
MPIVLFSLSISYYLRSYLIITVTSLNTQAVNLKGTFDISFEFNTSKCDNHTISFHDLEVKVWWFGKDNITLAEMRLSPFTQRINSVIEVEAILKVVDGFSNNNDVAKRISDEFVRGYVNFGVSLFGFVRFEDGSSKSLKFVCNPIVIVFHPVATKVIGRIWCFHVQNCIVNS